MSDEWGEPGGAAAAAPDPDPGPSAGALLRQAREASGLHVAALAVALKVPVRKLEALEDNRFDQMPDVVFVRGLASSVCRTLKIDPQPILDRLPQTTAPRLVRDSDGINTPFRAPGDGAPPGWTQQLRKPVFLIVFALLAGALALVLWPIALPDEPALAPVGTEITSVPPPAAMPAPAVPPAADPVPAPVTLAAGSAPVAARTTASAPAPVSASTPAGAASSPVAGIVVFRAKGPSWVEVTDAKGVVALRKVLAAGEATAASGALPLHVTVGRTDMTDVQVRGKPFDLRPVSRDNVARFEVK